MKISDYDYQLPDERIAQFPPEVRGTTRLLTLERETGKIEHRHYSDMADYLSAGDVVVINDTKVIKARLVAKNSDGKPRELLLIEEHGKHTSHNIRKCLYRGKIRDGEVLYINKTAVTVKKVLTGGIAEIESTHDLLSLADQVGSVPLPPYMKREATSNDTERYQTVFADKAGSVAAPTASLNFTDELRDMLLAKGVKIVHLTLHVGLGTFLPIRTDNIEEHEMHSEYYEIPAETVRIIKQAHTANKRICAIGTTVTRTLEYAHQDILENEPKDLSGEANIFMYPGYEFKLVNMLLTNFHAPRTTVLMLAAAFACPEPSRRAGWDNLKTAYKKAVEQNYNFLSYGDSMLII